MCSSGNTDLEKDEDNENEAQRRLYLPDLL